MSTDDRLDPVIHAPVRLRIMVALAALGPGDSLSFARLRDLLDLTAGNLITHVRRLEEAGYVESHRPSRRGDAATTYRMTAEGVAALGVYRRRLEQLLGQLPPG